GEPDFDFGEQELRAHIEGQWQGFVVRDGEDDIGFELTLEQAETVQTNEQQLRSEDTLRTRRQASCGTTRRDFIMPADACAQVIETVMQVRGELLIDGEAREVQGNVIAHGETLDITDLEIEGDQFYFGARCDSDRYCSVSTSVANSGSSTEDGWMEKE
ncbi:MAG: hypothetical protein ACLFVJ_11390, partial [Persicimonas sp.]